MGLFKNQQLFIIRLVCWLGWLSSFAFAQSDISEVVSGILNFPTLGVTCLGNLAVFLTCLIRGRLDVEMGARDALDILTSPKLKIIKGINENEIGLTTCKTHPQIPPYPLTGVFSSEGHPQTASVVILSNDTPNLAIKDFMKSNARIVDSILLEFRPFMDAENDAKYTLEISPETLETHPCSQSHKCKCIVFQTVEQITIMLASRMPGTLKQLTDSLYLLPCLNCLTDGCHRCDEGLQHVTEVAGSVGLRAGSKVESPAAVVCEILNGMDGQKSIRPGQPICICIPTHGARSDVWTELLLRTLRSKDVVDRGVRVMASEALEGYLVGRRGGEEGTVEYNIMSFVLPRLTEVAINLALTFWFRVDGFSSSLLARRETRDYVADSKGSGLAVNAFLTKAEVKSDANNAQVCQVLSFRGNRTRFLSFIVAFSNLISSVAWVVLIAFERRPYVSPPVSNTSREVIIHTIGFIFVGIYTYILVCIFPSLFKDCFNSFRSFFQLRFNGFGSFFQACFCFNGFGSFFQACFNGFGSFFQACFNGFGTFFQACFCFNGFGSFFQACFNGFGGFFQACFNGFGSFFQTCFCFNGFGYFFQACFCFNGFGSCFNSFAGQFKAFFNLWKSDNPRVFWLSVYHMLSILVFLIPFKKERIIYGSLQIVVWFQWTFGSYFLTFEKSLEFEGKSPHTWGILIYSSAFFLNAVLVGVRCKWGPWP